MFIMMLCKFFIDNIDYNFVQIRTRDISFTSHATFSVFHFFHSSISDQKRLFYKDLRSALIELKLLKINHYTNQMSEEKAKIDLKT